MVRREVVIANKLGFHARAAARFVQLASGFASDIKVGRNGKEVNGKSIMGVMMLAAAQGTAIEIMASGQDEDEAVQSLAALVVNRFGEPE
jgi:phosphocarrier protein HPr